MQRRSFVRAFGALSAVAAGPFAPRFRLADAQVAGSLKTLIVIFQRGGCDGLNEVVPYGDPDYRGLRSGPGGSIAIAPPSPSDPSSAIDLDGFFGLHPAMLPLFPAFAEGDLAIFPAAHHPDASRSHFKGQDFIESADPTDGPDGWLNRHLASRPGDPDRRLRAVGIGSSVPRSLRGNAVVSAFDNVVDFDLNLPDEEERFILDRLGPVYDQAPDPSRRYRELLHRFGRVVLNDLGIVADIDVASYQPENGAAYPGTTFGRQMRQTAQLVKEASVEVATLNIGGWDTHSAQGGGDPDGRQAHRFADFAGGIAALRADLGPQRMHDTVILTCTEFGRTARMNGSFGTDHGHACVYLVVGGGLNGGISGGWPGLAEENLVEGRYLAHTVDFRDIFGDVLQGHLGDGDLASVLPGHAFQSTGLFG